MVLHVIHSTEDAPTLLALGSLPLTSNAGVVLRLVPRAVFLARKAADVAHAAPSRPAVVRLGHRDRLRLRTALDAAVEVLRVAVEVFAEIAPARKQRARRASGVRAAPHLGRGRHARLWNGDAVGEERRRRGACARVE